jgi:tagatose-1,6-bisphosphate aldolase
MPEHQLTVGKLRGLGATSSPTGIFTILAFDHRQSFVKLLDPQAPERVTYGEVVAAKAQVVRALAPYTSAVLLDPVYGAAQAIASGALPGQAGLLVALEETGYEGEDTARMSAAAGLERGEGQTDGGGCSQVPGLLPSRGRGGI